MKRLKGEKPPRHPMDVSDFHVMVSEDRRSVLWLMHPQLEHELAIILSRHCGSYEYLKQMLDLRREMGIGLKPDERLH